MSTKSHRGTDRHNSGPPLAAFLDPRSVAIIGASDNVNKIGGRPLLYLARAGYKGRVYPINPNRNMVQGLRAYPDVLSLPETPDAVVVAVPAAQAIDAIRQCASRDVKAAIVMSSGFAETGDAAGIDAEQRLLMEARAAGMRIVGPNSQGLANFATGAILSFSTMFLEIEPADGPVAVISQSGVMSVVPYLLLRQRGIGVRHAHATGNETDVTLADLAVEVIHDPGVRLLLLYLESMRSPERLADVARMARERDIPIVAVKAGRTKRGKAAARSHTAALATEDRLVDAFFRDHGIWRARDVHELVRAADLYLKDWRPRGRRLAVVSNSGASCVMSADAAEEFSLELATFSPQVASDLRARLPSFATVGNPVDLTAGLLTDRRLLGDTLNVLGGCAAADLYLLALPVSGEGYDVPAFASDVSAFASETGCPVAVATPQVSVAEQFRQCGVPTFANHTEAIASLAQLVDHVALMQRQRSATFGTRPVTLPPGASRFWSEAESLSILQSYGLPVVPFRLCRSELEVRNAVHHLGLPVALKACSADVPHKSEYGLVRLGINNEADAVRTFDELIQAVDAIDGTLQGVIVASMASGQHEFTLGAKIDPLFGPIVMVGDGGKYAEALGDVVLLTCPFSANDVREALLRLRIAPIFAGVRGERPLDLVPLCDAAVTLGELIVAARGRIAAFDVNPVIVGIEGEGALILDALAERAGVAPNGKCVERFEWFGSTDDATPDVQDATGH